MANNALSLIQNGIMPFQSYPFLPYPGNVSDQFDLKQLLVSNPELGYYHIILILLFAYPGGAMYLITLI